MAGQYDYSINIPQPPAQNFLQNLMGIRQLQQMDEQSAIQQQQAGFQAQQAQFAQQMQPLQLQAEQARIGQIEQATATSAAALRQGKLTFEQAQIDRANALKQQAAAQEKQQELLGKFTSLPANAPMSEIVPIANQLLLLPGGDKISKQAMENFDALQQEYQKASKTALVTATNQLQAGDVKAAKTTYNTFEQAVRNSGGTNPQLVQLADGIKAQSMLLDLPNDQGVNSAKLAAVQMLSIIDPKAADTILKADEQAVESPLKAAQARLATADAVLKEIEAQGGPKSDKIIKQENFMRSAFSADSVVRNYESADRNWNIIQTAENSTAGDRSRIVSFIKLQQPDSVVSVTESGQIEAPTASQQAKALIQKWKDEGLLGDSAREELQSQAKSIYKASEFSFKKLKANTEKMASGYGIDPKNVTGLFEGAEIKREEPASGPSAEEARIRSMLRPAAGFGNTMTPSQIQPQGGTFQGTPTDVDAILKQFGVR